jgi:GrpB-like predicted nucleotidyltransferase (UPF0157 family)
VTRDQDRNQPAKAVSRGGESAEEAAERAELGRRFPIVLTPYDPRWPQLFEQEAELLRSKLPSHILTGIEHYGSTAVPGLAAKPIIDILVEVVSFEAAEAACVPILEGLTYGYNWYAGHMAFFKGYIPEEQPLKYHIHMAPGSHHVMDGLLFRDYLRKHPDIARQYEELKYRLAETYRYDREGYTEAKGEFVSEITEKAKDELGVD